MIGLGWGKQSQLPLYHLHMAAEHHNHRVVSSLIEAGAHLDAVNRNGDTTMDIAIKRDDPEILAAIPASPRPLYCQVSRFIATSWAATGKCPFPHTRTSQTLSGVV